MLLSLSEVGKGAGAMDGGQSRDRKGIEGDTSGQLPGDAEGPWRAVMKAIYSGLPQPGSRGAER